ncbi:hypothetical protein MKW92_052424, partial [Papaver armeniacum]
DLVLPVCSMLGIQIITCFLRVLAAHGNPLELNSWHEPKGVTKTHIIFCSWVSDYFFLLYIYSHLGLKYSSPTIANAVNNVFPALTFVAAVLFRFEKVHLRSNAGWAQILGTILTVGGAMTVTFYTGSQLNVENPAYDFSYLNGSSTRSASVLGPLFIALSCIARCGWFLLQKGLGDEFPYPITSTAATSVFSTLQCAIIGVIMEHGSGWSLRSKLRLISVIYSGVFGSAIACLVTALFIAKKGPVFVSMFNPLSLIIVAVLGWAFLKEKLYIGSLLGSSLILMGFFGVLWGNWKEARAKTHLRSISTGDIEEGLAGGESSNHEVEEVI